MKRLICGYCIQYITKSIKTFLILIQCQKISKVSKSSLWRNVRQIIKQYTLASKYIIKSDLYSDIQL